MKNNEDYYERIYKTIGDILSSIGGVSHAIIFIVHIINKLITQLRFNERHTKIIIKN